MEPRSATLVHGDPRRSELADFLKSRRSALAPERVGLASGPRRRTPGLRREEVAERAGISVALYTWLEQGRDVPVSARTLEAVADALQLTPGERLHVHKLTQRREIERETVTPALSRMVMAATTNAIIVLDRRMTVLLQNAVATVIFGLPEQERANILETVLTDARMRTLYGEHWPSVAQFLIANFRLEYALHADEPVTTELVARLARESPDFARWWSQHDIALQPEAVREVLHPVAGPIALETLLLASVESPGLRLMVFTPVGAESTAKIASLMAAPVPA